MRSLYEIEVSVMTAKDNDDSHDEITVAGITDLWSYKETHPFGPDVLECDIPVAQRHIAGILGRLVFAATPWMNAEQDEHGCRPWFTQNGPDDPPLMHDGCSLIDPGDDWGSSPSVWFYVPPGRSKVWLGRIQNWLDAIAKADR